MEKSIESIWKEGFLKNDALVAPKVNNLYTQKSIHIIDKFKRMFKINLIAIVAFAFTCLFLSYFQGILIMGSTIFVVFMVLVFINKTLLNGLKLIDKGENSFQYLASFNEWLNQQFSINKKISTFLYPILFLSFVVGFWFKEEEDGLLLGQKLVAKITIGYPDLYLVNGVPLIAIIVTVLIAGLLAFFGGKIYEWDVKIVYGRVFKKLKELLTDIESLNS